MGLVVAEYPHVLEYYRERGNGDREHVYTEAVDDHGFVFVHDPGRRQQWLAHYARTCAEDYLSRARADHGDWLVHVHRIRDEQRHHIVSIRMRWPGQPG